MTPHYLTEAFNISLSSSSNTMTAQPGAFLGLGLIAAGGALAFLWHPAALALCAWGVFGAIGQAHSSLVSHIIALNDSLIALDAEQRVDADRIERAVQPLSRA